MARLNIYLTVLISCLPWQILAFFRTAPDISPADTNYTIYGPVTNLTESMTINYGQASTSFWIAYYIAGDNGHDYFAIACQASQLSNITTFISLLDITTTIYQGANFLTPGTISNTTFDIESSGLHMYAASPDLYSVLVSDSTIPGMTFNLTSQSEGPNLYHGGSGSHTWGIDVATLEGPGLTNQWASPNMWVTGTITDNDTTVNVIPEKSRSWLDRQWGQGGAIGGWHWYTIFLDNGVTLAIWHTNPIPGYNTRTDSFATILFVDGHHEIYPVDTDLHPTNPFVSAQTNLTYYGGYQLVIPGANATLNLTLAVAAGEMAYAEAPTAANSLAESYVNVVGSYQGLPVSGYGLVEVKYSLSGEVG